MRNQLIDYIRTANKTIFEVKIEQQKAQEKAQKKRLQERRRQMEVMLMEMDQFYGDQKSLLNQHLRQKREEANVLEMRQLEQMEEV